MSLFACTIAVLMTPFVVYGQGLITTIAGGGTFDFPASANGGAAIRAPLRSVTGVAVDSVGNIFASDTENNMVVRISRSGILTIVAGTGINASTASSGDGGPAVNAAVFRPRGLAVDAAGNLYIAENAGNRIRKVTVDGMIATVAGNGSNSGLYGTGDGGQAASAYLPSPWDVAVDRTGNLYIVAANRIRKVAPDGIISTIAGTGQSGFSGDGGPAASAQLRSPWGVAVDARGVVYVADTRNNRIRKIDATGTITTVAGNGQEGFSGDEGPAINAQLFAPQSVTVDEGGNLYIADTANARVRKVTAQGIISTVAGRERGQVTFSGDGGPATSAQLRSPQAVEVDASGNVYVADFGNQRVRKVDPAGVISTIAGSGEHGSYGDGGPATSAQLTSPNDVAVVASGDLYIADSGAGRIRKVTPAGIMTTVVGHAASGFSGDGGQATVAALSDTRGIDVDALGNLYVADASNHRIRQVTLDGTIKTFAGGDQSGFSGDGGPAVRAQLNYPANVAIDAEGNLYIADSKNHRIRKVDRTGAISTVAGTGEAGFSGDGGPATNARLRLPAAVAVDQKGNLYIAESLVVVTGPGPADADSNHRIRKVDIHGTITTVAGNGKKAFSGDGGPAIDASLCFPQGVEVDTAGNIYIVDSGNNVIRKVNPQGIISTVAGTPGVHGPMGTLGDDGLSTRASLFFGVDDYVKAGGGVAVDSAGNMYVADFFHSRVRKVSSSPFIEEVVDAARFAYSPSAGLAPGTLVSIFGANFADDAKRSAATVTIGNLPAPLLYVSPTQINAQIPFEVPLGTVPVEVRQTDLGATTSSILVGTVSPAIFRLLGNRGAILTSTGEVAATIGSVGDRPARPAKRGEFVSIFCTGLGDVTNRPANGAAAPSQPPFPETALKPKVLIGGVEATPSFAGLAPFLVGVYQLNVQIPETVPAGDAVGVVIRTGGADSNSVTIAVQ